MILKIRYWVHGLHYSVQTLLLGKKIPFIAGLVLNNECNLACQHCGLKLAQKTSLTFHQVENAIDLLYSMGIRSIAITGGEPFMWHDGNYRVNDIIDQMYRKGILVTSVYTNGTFAINSNADNVFVSIDGTEQTTNKLRGPVFQTVIDHIRQSNHPKIFVNYTINSKNAHEMEDFCRFTLTIPQIKGICFYFHTPYYGIDELFQPFEVKTEIARQILELKKKYPIVNSKAALNDYINNHWQRPSKVCVVYTDKGELVDCCRALSNPEACINCGYLGYLEVIDITRLKWSAICEGSRYIPSRKSRLSYVS